MRILITGNGGKAGSWKIRGEQIGGLVGTVKPRATLADCKNHDLILYVKRLHAETLNNIRKSGRPWVWDLVDFYPQPECTHWNRETAIKWVQDSINRARPNGIIWPCKRMRDDCCGSGIVAYHHSRDGALNPIREKIRAIGYQGEPKYLGRYQKILETECFRRGWAFKINPELRDIDAVVALRDTKYNGYVQRHWKSNVKLTNAHGTGTPFIGQQESAYQELASGKELFASTSSDIAAALTYIEPRAVRLDIRNAFLSHAIPIENVASQIANYCYKVLLDTL